MRIRSWHIDGFGIHRDWRIDDLSPGLSVFYGPNEAGKTTLLAFVRGVLFGYPDGRSREAKYPPEGGGPHGGRLTLETREGTVVVERFAGRGSQLSVTLEDGTPGDAAALSARLGSADARLFRSVYAFGLSELQELETLGDAGVQDHLFSAGVTGAGRSARQASRELDASARDLFAGVRARKSDQARKLVEEIRSVRSDLYLRQEAAERYPEVRAHERSLAARLEELEAEAEAERACEQRASKLVELWNDAWCPLASLREQAAKLQPGPDELPMDARPRLEAALREIQQGSERLDSIRGDRTALAARLAELRPDESARAVAGRVASLHEHQALYRSQCDRLAELRASQDEIEARVARIVGRLPEGFDEARLRDLRPEPRDREELRDWKRRLDAEESLDRERELATRIAVEQRDRSRAHWELVGARDREAPSRPEVGRALALAAGFGAIGGWLSGSLLGLLVVFVLAGVAAIWLTTRRRRDRAEAARRHAREQLDLHAARVTAAQHEQARGRERLAERVESFRAWKQSIGLPQALSAELAIEFLEDVQRGHDALDEADRLADERRRLERQIEGWNADVDAVLAECAPQDLEGDADRVSALAALRQCCESDRAAREGRLPLERHDAALRDRLSDCEKALERGRQGLSLLLGEAGAESADDLERRLAARDAAQRLAEEIARVEEDLARRIAAAGPAGGPDEAAQLRELLPSGRVDEWEERASRARERIARIRGQRDEALREHQDAARLREQLEESTDVMDLSLRKSALEQELHEVLDEWRRLRLAGRLIDTALERFEARHQPGVLREASTLFAAVTAGRYPRIVQSDQERAGFSVLNEKGMHRSPKELSRGTAEQLYLCVRLGLVAELARSRISLPVVMDDVLVNFDDERAAAMAEVLARFANDHQLLFFTCSSRTRDLLLAARPDADERSLRSARHAV